MSGPRPGTTVHGMYGTPTYRSWAEMKTRVKNPNRARFSDYGGRGIDMDPRWEAFSIFLSDMGTKTGGQSIERIDNLKGYWPENCRWATLLEQANNKRNNHFLTINGESKTIAQWSRDASLPRWVLQGRISLGWTGIRLLSPPNKLAGRFVKKGMSCKAN